MTDKITLFRCGSAAVYEDDGWYYDSENGLTFRAKYLVPEGEIMRFRNDSDIGIIAGEPLDLLLQCLEHRLATRNLADPMFERTNALECLRKMRMWLGRLAEMEQESA